MARVSHPARTGARSVAGPILAPWQHEPVTFDDPRVRPLLWAAWVLVGLGVYAFVLRGADQPADPYVAPATSTTLASGVVPPGDPTRVPLEGFGEVAITVTPAGGGDLLAWCLPPPPRRSSGLAA